MSLCLRKFFTFYSCDQTVSCNFCDIMRALQIGTVKWFIQLLLFSTDFLVACSVIVLNEFLFMFVNGPVFLKFVNA